MSRLCEAFSNKLQYLRDFPPLFFRLILAYGFYEPALSKINNFSSIVTWFESMGIPYPLLNAYAATGTEALGVILLTLGFFTRLISLPLMVVMCVAIKMVHWEHGFSASQNGFEVPLYYLLMLFSLFISGSGRISLDGYICKKPKEQE